MPGRACTEAALLVLPGLQPLFGLDGSAGAETWPAPPPASPLQQGEMEEGQPVYLQLQGAFTPCLLLLLALPLLLHVQVFPHLLRLSSVLGQLELGDVPLWRCPCRVLPP